MCRPERLPLGAWQPLPSRLARIEARVDQVETRVGGGETVLRADAHPAVQQ